MKYHFKVHKEGKFYWAQCLELEGCVTQGRNLKELNANMQEALNLYIQEPDDSTDLAVLPRSNVRKSKNIAEVSVDPEIAFAFMVRYHRIKKHRMTQNQAAKKMGFETIYSYQRLEAKKCNPSLKMMTKIKRAFPDFSIDYALGA